MSTDDARQSLASACTALVSAITKLRDDAPRDEPQRVQVAAAPYVTVALAAAITGLSQKAIRRKIEDGKWIEGREFRRAPDGGIFVSMDGFKRWIEGT
ncbi:excisionase [Burkholderia gladioli]|uniref:excisionase n=1 Tax=Burkholderia gladioli TaxID=28095 RepID=UPI003C7EC96D